MLKKLPLVFVLSKLPKGPLMVSKYPFCAQNTESKLKYDIESKIIKVLQNEDKCDLSKLSKTSTFQQIGFDSLDTVDLVITMEHTFGVDIPMDEANMITSIPIATNTFYKHVKIKIER